MPALTLLRFISALITAALFIAMPGNKAWTDLVFALGFSHYATALIYSRRQISAIAVRPHSYIPFLILCGCGIALYAFRFPLVLYFGIHHVFNEVYLMQNSSDFKPRKFSALIFNGFLYLALVRSYPKLAFIPAPFLWCGVIASGIVFFYFLISSREKPAEMMDHCSLEIIGLIALGCSFFVEVSFLQIVCYHFIFWILFPAQKFVKKSRSAFINYALITIGINAIFLLISPIGWQAIRLDDHLFDTQFRFWSHFHITLSFALSDAHPQWIRQWFRSQPKPVAV